MTTTAIDVDPRATRTATAARYYGVGDVRIEEIEVAAPAADEVTVRVAYAGLCGSDLHEYFAGQTVTPVEPHPLTGASLPVVLGHEFAGTIVAVGSGVTDRTVGERVAVRPTYSCGTCPSCRRGHPNTCVNLAFHGLSASGGGLSTFTTLPASMTFPLPDAVTLQQGALVEPMAVAFHGVSLALAGTTPATAFVGGAGPIGLGAVFALRQLGVEHVVVSDVAPSRRELAARIGATQTFDPRERDLLDVLGDRVLDVAVEAAGVGDVIAAAVAAVGARGRVVLLGIHERPMDFDPTSLLYREATLVGSSTYTDDDYRGVIAAMAGGSYPPDGWVETRPLADLHAAFDELRGGGAAKILIELPPA